jgi:uncharacterized protein (TIGR04222 family)
MSLFDVFPWNVESGPAFLAGYASVSILVLSVLAIFVRTILDRPATEEAPLGIYRSPARTLTLDVAWLAADLRGGLVAVREAMLAALVTAGGLTRADDGTYAVSDAPLDDRSLETLRRRIAHGGKTTAAALSSEALVVAGLERHARRAVLEAGGLVPSKAQRSRAAWVTSAVAAPLLGIGFVRVLRGVDLHRPIGFLLAMLVGIGIAAIAIAVVEPRTAAARAWLETMSSDTLSHAFRARTGGASVLDAGLAAAVFGLASLDAAPAFAALSSSLSAAATSSGGSSCSSGGSSCGGGGCGGGGCGGGCGG